MKVLLVGLESKLAHECVSWSSVDEERVPNFGEYDFVILYLPTLIQGTFTYFANTTIEDIREKILKTISRTNTQIFCVTARNLNNQHGKSLYSMFPFTLSFIGNESGSILSEKPNNSYFAKVKKWEYCFEGIENPDKQGSGYYKVAWLLKNIASTKYLEHVAFTVTLAKTIREGGRVVEEITTPVFFLPPTTSDDEETVRELISCYINPDKYTLPDFVKEIKVPGEKQIDESILSLRKTIDDATQKLEEEKGRQNKILFMKGIVGLRDKPLQRAVVRVFEDMGLSLDGKETYEEDKTFTYDENLIPVEIKGHKGAVTRQDVLQVMSRNEKAKVKDENYVKGILIANPYNETPLDERGIDFEPNIVKSVAGWNICLLSTRVLLQYWIEFRKTGKTNLGERLLTIPGVLEYKASQTSKEKTNS